MQFNPSKCETIRITRKRNPILTNYDIHGHQLATVPSGKYLGAMINEKLLCNDHVDYTTKKANNSLAFLRRNITSCPRDIKAQCYKTLVRPIMEYASPAWDPHTTTNINKLEAVQRRAARFVTGDYRRTSSTSQMITTLGWPSLQQRRADAKLVLVYRITHHLVDIPAPVFLHPAAVTTKGRTLKYLLPFCLSPSFLLPFCDPTMEPVAGSHRHIPDLGQLQGGTGPSTLDAHDFIRFYPHDVFAPHNHLVHSSQSASMLQGGPCT